MLTEIPYRRERAVQYARRWARGRNPLFADFTGRGGDCTNFVSQCIYAGSGIMNFTPTFGWYYLSPSSRAPAWAGVDEFFGFIVGSRAFLDKNGGTGPRGFPVSSGEEIEIGDVIQLADSAGDFYHSLIVSGFREGDILVCAHSDDALDRPLSQYNYASLRVIHIEGVILDVSSDGFFNDLLNGVARE